MYTIIKKILTAVVIQKNVFVHITMQTLRVIHTAVAVTVIVNMPADAVTSMAEEHPLEKCLQDCAYLYWQLLQEHSLRMYSGYHLSQA